MGFWFPISARLACHKGPFSDVVGYARSGFQKGLGCRMNKFPAVYVGGSDEVVNLARGK